MGQAGTSKGGGEELTRKETPPKTRTGLKGKMDKNVQGKPDGKVCDLRRKKTSIVNERKENKDKEEERPQLPE